VDEDRESDELTMSLPLKQKREFVHEQEGCAKVSATSDLQMIAKDAHQGWFGEMYVDRYEEAVGFVVYDNYGGHTLAFRFLRCETAGMYPPKFTVADVKVQTFIVHWKESGIGGAAGAARDDSSKFDAY
jgi:hypothetical protein